MPLLALLIPIEQAVPLAVLLSILVSAVIVVQDWREVHIQSAQWLILSTLLGIPCGLLLLTGLEERLVKGILASVIVVFSSYSLLVRQQLELKTDRLAFGFGFSSATGYSWEMGGKDAAEDKATDHAFVFSPTLNRDGEGVLRAHEWTHIAVT